MDEELLSRQQPQSLEAEQAVPFSSTAGALRMWWAL